MATTPFLTIRAFLFMHILHHKHMDQRAEQNHEPKTPLTRLTKPICSRIRYSKNQNAANKHQKHMVFSKDFSPFHFKQPYDIL